ncbi:MAG: hypothetical protein BZ151_11525 [Desulfobacca sp. 4484_104]|nr:MAG: hypothetical protein BZ151_11525 [Desulfobacca sp. 4484_104]
MIREKILGLLLISFLALSGCSVGMAMSGKKEPNLSILRVGTTKGEVEVQLGQPVSVVTAEDGSQAATYEFETGNEPSAGRAVAHGLMDVVTLGLWEAVGTPIEGSKGNKRQVIVNYGPDEKVRGINQPLTPVGDEEQGTERKEANT